MHLPRFRRILLAALTAHVLTAWFSSGYFAADEHYQVIAFAEAKAGNAPLARLPWEYAAQVRSVLLPAVCMAVFGAARSIGIHDPFVLAFLLRLLTALFAITAVTVFVRAASRLVERRFRKSFQLLSWFLWFLPFLHARFTGETWSGLFLLLALAAVFAEKPDKRSFIRTGIFLGLAILCRPPVLAAAAGLVMWLAMVKRAHITMLLHMLAGCLVIAAAGIFLDSWFYGRFTVTAWNYLRLGITGTGNPSFTEYPWWYYYAWVFKYSIPVFGAIILLAFGLLCAYRPRHPLTWVLVPFLVFHMLVPHKELRFLFPIADLMPLLLVTALPLAEAVFPRAAQVLGQRAVRVAAGALFLAINAVALLASSLSPAGSGRTRLAEYVRAYYPRQPVKIHYLANDTTVWDIRIPRFYLGANVTDTISSTPCMPLSESRGRMDLVVARGTFPSCADAPMGHGWEPLLPAQPAWKERLMRFYEWEDAKPAWVLYRPRTALE